MICGNRIAPEISDFEYLPTLAAPGWRNLIRISFGDITKGAMIDRRRSRFGDRAFLPRCPFLGSLLRRKCLRGPLAFTKDLCPDGSRVELSEPCLNHPLRTGVFRASHEGLNWSDWQTRSGKLARSGRKLPLFYCTGGKPGKVMVRMVGLEPTLLAETEFESVASTIPPHPQRTEPAWQRQDQDPAGGHRFADWSPGRYARVASPAAALMASMRGGRQGSWRFNPGIRAMFAPRAWMKSDRTAFGGPQLYRSGRTKGGITRSNQPREPGAGSGSRPLPRARADCHLPSRSQQFRPGFWSSLLHADRTGHSSPGLCSRLRPRKPMAITNFSEESLRLEGGFTLATLVKLRFSSACI